MKLLSVARERAAAPIRLAHWLENRAIPDCDARTLEVTGSASGVSTALADSELLDRAVRVAAPAAVALGRRRYSGRPPRSHRR